MSKKKTKYSGVSIPIEIAEEIDKLIEELGYWPSRGAFAREALLEKIRKERRRLTRQTDADETPSGGLTGDQPPLKP